MIPIYHQCDYCQKTFVSEKNLKGHQEKSCEFKSRYDHIVNTTVGMAMYDLYCYWLRSNGKSTKYVDRNTFIHSIHYKAFGRFLEFSKKKSIPNKKVYIKVCNGFNLSPRDWSNENVYAEFIEIYDEYIPINQQIEGSLNTIFSLADALEIEPSDIFVELDASDVSKLIKSRKISPWFFLNSQKFREFLVNNASASDREHINKSTNPEKWKKIFEQKPKKRKKVCDMIKQLGL